MLLLGWLAVSFLTAIAASSKNRSALAGFLVGAFLPVIGLVGYLIAKPLPVKAGGITEGLLANSHGERQCPQCAELIKMQASKCRFCSASVDPISEAEADAARARLYEPMRRNRMLIVCVMGVAVIAGSYLLQS